MCMLWVQSIPSVPLMPIGWNGLSMTTYAGSVHMPIGRVNFKVRGVKEDSIPHMMEIVLTNIPVKCGIVD